MSADDEIVMTPLRVETGTTVKIERVKKEDFDVDSVQLFAGGPYKGMVIRKQTHESPDSSEPSETREFICYVSNPKLPEDDPEAVIKEKRTIRFWFEQGTTETDKAADRYVEQLLQPRKFPKGSIFYVKQLMTLMRPELNMSKVEAYMRPLADGEEEELRANRENITRVNITAAIKRYPKAVDEDAHLHLNGELLPLSAIQYADRTAHKYRIEVHTGSKWGAGTDANVWIRLFGDAGVSEQFYLDNEENNFERNKIDTFYIECPNMGSMDRIRIGQDDTGPGAAWYLDKVII